MTCTTEPAGICLGCSLNCHDGHELKELYSKRKFQCDCGNGKFPSKCSLTPDKPTGNDRNQYNQNFKGLYCTCARPYPDPERTTPESMLQCIICEDWYHDNHLTSREYESKDDKTIDIPKDEDFEEVVCGGCMQQHEFLRLYEDLPIEVVKSEAPACVLEDLKQKQAGIIDAKKGMPAFMKDSWRKTLCGCSNCLTMYLSKGIEFLPDEEDTLKAYESKAQVKTADDAFSASSDAFEEKLSHSQKVEMAIGYRDMSTQLNEYLRGFAESKRVVTKDDISSFFEELSNKRQKVRK